MAISATRPFPARIAGPCPAADQCAYPDRRINIGDDIRKAEGVGWVHQNDNVRDALAKPWAGADARAAQASELRIAAEADRLLNEYDAIRHAACRARNASIPTGNYTVRPADESSAVVLSVGETTKFNGSFPLGSRKIAVRGSFSIMIGGLSEHRTWYGFAVVKPVGSVSLYKNARAVLEAAPADLRAEDVHLQAKLRQAIKALRLLIDAGIDEIMSYGKAYASAEAKCWRCERPLTDETSQRLGIGPHCRQIVSQEMGQDINAGRPLTDALDQGPI